MEIFLNSCWKVKQLCQSVVNVCAVDTTDARPMLFPCNHSTSGQHLNFIMRLGTFLNQGQVKGFLPQEIRGNFFHSEKFRKMYLYIYRRGRMFLDKRNIQDESLYFVQVLCIYGLAKLEIRFLKSLKYIKFFQPYQNPLAVSNH